MDKSDYDSFISAAKQQQTEAVVNKQDFFFKGLVTDKPMNYIKESDFKLYLLPGLTPGFITNKDIYARFIRNWIAIAGAAACELGVVNDVTGELMFTCPSLYDTTVINTDREIGDSKTIARFFIAYQQQMKHMEAAANSFFNNNGQQVLDKAFLSHPNMPSITEKWLHIYSRYGIQLPQSQTTVSAAIANTGNDEAIYD